jgi:2-polyprenyl-6-methoxyphenol hydroxylase-like FAD-dependent oxidoreductase
MGVAQEMQYERPDVGVLPKRDFGISVLCASRPLIELVLRRQAAAVANITLRPRCRVTEIVPATARAAVHGVRCDFGSGRSETLEANLVVDASGRGALTSTLFDTLGWERPQETDVGVDIRYATAVVPIPADAPPDWKVVLTQSDPPTLPFHEGLLPMEDRRWIILIADHGIGAPIETWDDFLEASRLLITPTIFKCDPPRRAALRHSTLPLAGKYLKTYES